jgi:hypothetical protein
MGQPFADALGNAHRRLPIADALGFATARFDFSLAIIWQSQAPRSLISVAGRP